MGDKTSHAEFSDSGQPHSFSASPSAPPPAPQSLHQPHSFSTSPTVSPCRLAGTDLNLSIAVKSEAYPEIALFYA